MWSFIQKSFDKCDYLHKSIIEFIGGMNPVSRQICAFIAFGNRYIWPFISMP